MQNFYFKTIKDPFEDITNSLINLNELKIYLYLLGCINPKYILIGCINPKILLQGTFCIV